MKIVIAPDSYKESVSAMQVANSIEKGFKQVFSNANYIKIPVADGGEGTVETMVEATQGKVIKLDVTDALGKKQPAFWGISADHSFAFIEIAAACGLEKVPIEQRNPLITTTFGVGELILSALDFGVRHFMIGLGGSATNDGGAGMLQALGVQLLDKQEKPIGYGGAELARLDKIDLSKLDSRLKQCRFEVACDVTNPLTGEQGASAIFGPQKGATPDMVKQLDNALSHFAKIIQRDLNMDTRYVAGAGAAGGLGMAFASFLQAELKNGIGIITDLLKLEDKMKDADLVITGEGRLDHQSIKGKVPIGVAAIAKKLNIPVIAIAGSLGKDIQVVYDYGLDAVFSVLNTVCTLPEALQHAENNLEITARNVAATLKINLS
ncbi:glycerate kinase [Lonepinella koalarum]|uniref:Glycerate kinase n=1 Tax=Lonepinella koalarum TaxID=53417 RepID=A0A4R1KZF7_9PAST|nr:glycerate kinase [Lonepinella koalarum]MDH2927728.1 glycerate kinase [Lonepinella koalarum]TCK69923.1 glycerate kinase [Lonepinella koalarum]TFJ90473.1 glycerate kinase [Lonepinella koalarum]TYG35169.1 glycerate kinase [Lonepinella koalarum]